MPTIRLKPNSPEFDTGVKPSTAPQCDMGGCPRDGEFRAPMDRSLSGHYHFCQDHIREYNRAWNFFDGMNPAEVEEHVVRAFYGDRPTWKYREFTTMEEALFRNMDDLYNGEDSKKENRNQYDERNSSYQHRIFEEKTPETEALAIMGLSPPITLEDIKKEYKVLAKKYHPDHNRDNPEAEEVLKNINMAYTVLKVAYGRYENLMAKR